MYVSQKCVFLYYRGISCLALYNLHLNRISYKPYLLCITNSKLKTGHSLTLIHVRILTKNEEFKLTSLFYNSNSLTPIWDNNVGWPSLVLRSFAAAAGGRARWAWHTRASCQQHQTPICVSTPRWLVPPHGQRRGGNATQFEQPPVQNVNIVVLRSESFIGAKKSRVRKCVIVSTMVASNSMLISRWVFIMLFWRNKKIKCVLQQRKHKHLNVFRSSLSVILTFIE